MFHFENELEKTISDEIQIYAEKEYTSQLITVMLSKHISSHVSMSVDSMSLFESSILFAHYIFQNPRRALLLLDDAFQKLASNISKNHISKADMVFKENLHVRLIALPNLPEIYRSNLPTCSDVGQFLCISGTVVRTSTAKMLQYQKEWRCGKCKYQFTVKAEVEQGYVCEKPLYCQNPEWCGGKNFTLMSSDINAEWCKDYQEIKLQEQVYNLNVGTVPKSMLVVLEDDLVESCQPGNDVIVSGVLLQQWKPLTKGSLINIQLIILAHNIEVQNKMSSGVISKDMAKEFGQFWQDHKSDPLKGRNFILSCICPQVFGLYIVKLSVALVLASGVQKQCGSSRIRGDTHLLLVGDPGTAKSQFLKFAAKVSSRSVITSGIGTTNAGLTVSAVKESSRWELEAGALVLADGGICCIDEFSCIKEQDKTCIHEAMEQQTISVAKAGLVCSLNTRCSILAATNPKGKYDENMSISENTALGSPLLSRFDIILVLLDTYDEKWDDMVASYILDGRNLIIETNAGKLWSAAKVKNYFTLIRHINPKVNADAERVLRAYYTRQRSLQSRQASRTTPRLLQSLIRLAEGHARLMFRSEVLVSDAVTAIILIESSMLGNSILEGLSPLHTVFPDNPMAEYFEKAATIFENLGIELPVEESLGCFYEESTLNRLLLNISSVWSPKDDPFIFGSSACDTSDNSNLFQETLSDNNGTSRLQSFENSPKSTESIFHISTKKSYASPQVSCVQDIVIAEVHRNTDIITNVNQDENENKILVHPNSRDMFVEEMTNQDISSDIINKNSQSKISQVTILDQILDEDFEGNNNISLNPSHTELFATSTISMDQNATTSKTKLFSKNFIENKLSQEIITKTQPERNNDILEQLGISSSKEIKKSESNTIDLHTTALHSSSDKSRDGSCIFQNKKSLAEQLKSFTFKKYQVDPQNSLNHSNIKSVSKNKPKSNLKLGTDFLSNKDCDNSFEKASQSARQNSVFNMIKNKSKSYNNKDFPSTSKNVENDQSIQKINYINTINTKMASKDNLPESASINLENQTNKGLSSLLPVINTTESASIDLENQRNRDSSSLLPVIKTTELANVDLENQTNRDRSSSPPVINTGQPKFTNEKKTIRKDLQKFAFSRIKSSKNQNS